MRRSIAAARRHVAGRKRLVEDLLGELEGEKKKPAPLGIEQFTADRVENTQERVRQIRRELETRLEIHTRFLREIERQLAYAELSLEEFGNWGVGYNTGVDVKRNQLERQLQQLRTERRATTLRAWDDAVRLRKELRDAMLEYRGAERLAHSLSGSTEGKPNGDQRRDRA
jgi:hypothetical protein